MIRDWVRRKLGSVDHELRVGRVARTLFELTRRWHGLGSAHSRLLTLATLVHDVGRIDGGKGHAKRGAQMILESQSLRLHDMERRQLAYLTLYHRGKVPEADEEQFLDDRADDGRAMRAVLGILRAADSLDSRTRGGPRLVMTVRQRTLTIYGYLEGEAVSAAARYGRLKKLGLLEATLDCQVRTEWFASDQVGLVA